MTDNTTTTGTNGIARKSYRMAEHVTRSRWLHAEDAMQIQKLKLYGGEYKAGEGAKAQLAHYLDLPDAWRWMTDLATGTLQGDYVDFKGFINKATGEVRSRVLKMAPAKNGSEQVWIQLSEGPGKQTETGAITPAGKPDTQVNVPFTVAQARSFALVVLAYLQADAVLRLAAERKKAQ